MVVLLSTIRYIFSEINYSETAIRPTKATGSHWVKLTVAIKAQTDQCHGKQLSERHNNSSDHEATATRGWATALRSGDFIFSLCITKEMPSDLPCYGVTHRSFSFLAQLPLWPQKANCAPFGKEQSCAANCCAEKRKKFTYSYPTPQRQEKKKSYYLWTAYLWGSWRSLQKHSQEFRGKT